MRVGTRFLPTLNAAGSYQVKNTEQESDSPFSFGDTDNRTHNGQITLNWTLFDGFKMFINNSRFQELEKLGEYQSRNSIENSVIGILRSYYNVVQQKQLLGVFKNSLEKCLNSLYLNKPDFTFQVCVVDNASSESIKGMENQFDNVDFIFNKKTPCQISC